ncbi:MAG: penicillin-binding protein 2 [Rickettsiales bacterium]|jgi:cell division protein FtsI (penicillin-binding protein 3)|nr:penicillin-binding protein 2 [Rickettsiales bacterium]
MITLGDDILTLVRENRPLSNGRQLIVFLVVLSVFLFLCAYTLTLGMSGRGRTRSVQPDAAETARADIIDRNGEILAKNVYTYDLVANARQIADADAAAAFVHGLFPEISANAVLRKIKTGGGYVELKKNIGKDAAAVLRAEKIPGVSAVLRQVREYPKHNSMSHIVGFVYGDGSGADGAERMMDARLRTDGAPLRLSIDSRIQSLMWTELSAAARDYKARAAMGVLMNARTGEILAAVSLPDFDPEDLGAYPDGNRRFRLMRDNYEIGSIFKIFNTALALANGIPVSKKYNIIDPFMVGGKKIEEARGFRPPAKYLSVAQIMQYSCNSGSAQIALSLPENAQSGFFRELRFDAPIETNFGKTARPLFPQSNTATDRSRWSFGHGIAVTPLHVLLASNAIANDGKYIMPTILRRDFVPETTQIVSKEISRQLRQILFAVGDTSAKLAKMQIQGVNIGGKTSTAQKLVNGKYSNDKNISAFYVAFPIEAPKWSMLILLDEPGTYPRTAAYNAVPLAGKLLDAVIPLL